MPDVSIVILDAYNVTRDVRLDWHLLRHLALCPRWSWFHHTLNRTFLLLDTMLNLAPFESSIFRFDSRRLSSSEIFTQAFLLYVVLSFSLVWFYVLHLSFLQLTRVRNFSYNVLQSNFWWYLIVFEWKNCFERRKVGDGCSRGKQNTQNIVANVSLRNTVYLTVATAKCHSSDLLDRSISNDPLRDEWKSCISVSWINSFNDGPDDFRRSKRR